MVLQLISLKKVKAPLRKTSGTHNIFDDRMRYVSDSLYSQIRQTPELISMLDTVITDHFMGPVDFFKPDGSELGPTKLNQIRTFWSDKNAQHKAFYGQALDYFVDGSSFGWHVEPNTLLSAKQKEQIAKIKEIDFDIGKHAEDQANFPIKISYIAASTTEIKHDEFGELFYLQDTAGIRAKWNSNQIVHIKLMEFNGEIRGFSALKALTKEIVQMYLLKENIQAKLDNGGSADNIISMVGANGVSRGRFNRLQTALESFSHLKKSHGNMPIDAEVKVLPLGASLKDMEYRQLAMFIISEFALSLGLPTSRVPFLMTGDGGSSNKGELSGNSEDAYQTKINTRRKHWENSWNQVFRKAGFVYKFRRDNLQDDVRETQASVQRSAFVAGIQTSLLKAGKELKISALLSLLSGSKMNIEENDVKDIDIEKMSAQQGIMNNGSNIGGIGNEMQPSKSQLGSKVTQDKSNAKEKTASNNEKFK